MYNLFRKVGGSMGMEEAIHLIMAADRHLISFSLNL